MKMSNKCVLILLGILMIVAATTTVQGLQIYGENMERKTYIVYMGDVPKQMNLSPEEHHHSILSAVIGDEAIAREARVHSYGRSFYGFVANLLPHEAAKLQDHESVVSVFRNTKRKLATTRSWDFVGLTEKNTERNLKVESDVIIGMLDSGIDMGAPSFNDEGYGPPPAKWKGSCDAGLNFTGCNRKVIGARWYNVGSQDLLMEPTPYDYDGHGSHTASTAAGSAVKGASLLGQARGTARGAVPNARIAVYKVCSPDGCSDANILAAFDDAIADGVDVVSVSIGNGAGSALYNDVASIGAFHAMKKGVSTVMAGGNSGPDLQTVENNAPWVLTAAATNSDRGFVTVIKLGNGELLYGTSINPFLPANKMLPLITGESAHNTSVNSPLYRPSMCSRQALLRNKVEGKILLCYSYHQSDFDVHFLGGAGVIKYIGDAQIDVAHTVLIPSATVDTNTAQKLATYINSTANPTAMIYQTLNPINYMKAPVVASYSSRGPQLIARNILKPDISAPGTDILAAWSKNPSVTGYDSDTRHEYFSIESGTSMSTPHVSGAVAYVKSFHPDWSPAAIKSALMTTARAVNVSGPENPLASGSGLINPVRAVHPGLVYDMDETDYIRYLCREGYNSTWLAKVIGNDPNLICSPSMFAPGDDGINYPSMHRLLWIDEWNTTAEFYRTVTHVGYGSTTFEAVVHAPKEMKVTVTPSRLTFGRGHEKKSFTVEVEAAFTEESANPSSAFLEWTNSKYSVRSPIVLYRLSEIRKPPPTII